MTIKEEELKEYGEYFGYYRADFEDEVICKVYDWVNKDDTTLGRDERKLNII